MAHLARHVDVREEVHLDDLEPVPLTGLAASALHVEGETARFVPVGARFRRAREHVADAVEYLGVGGRVAARRAADGLLVDLDHLVQVLDAGERLVRPGRLARPVDGPRQRRIEDAVHQRGLAGARDTGHRDQASERELHVDLLQVVLGRPEELDALAAASPPLRWNLDLPPPGEIRARQRPLVLHHLPRSAGSDDLAAELAGARSEVDDEVRLLHRLLVVLDHDDGVAQIPQPLQRGEQPHIVALVQADGGLVQDVDDSSQLRPHLRGQPDALGLAAGERRTGTIERQIPEADVEQEAQAVPDLLQQLGRHHLVVSFQRQGGDELHRLLDRHPRDLHDALARHIAHVPDRHRAAFRAQALALAGAAGFVAEVAQVMLAHALGGGLLEAPHQHRDDAFEAGLVGAGAAALAPADAHRLVARAVEQQVLDLARQLLPGPVQRDLERAGERLDHPERPAALLLQRVVPRLDRAAADAPRGVGDDEVGIHLGPGAETVALVAHPERVVEGEAVRRQLREADAVHRAGEVLAVDALRLAASRKQRDGVEDALAFLERRLHRVDEAPRAVLLLHHQAIDHHRDVVLSLLVEVDVLVQIADHAVHPGPGETALARIGDHVLVLALALLDERPQQGEPGALGKLRQLLRDLLGALLAHPAPADGAVLLAHRGEEHAQVIVDLGDGPDGGARVVRSRLLLDGDGRRQATDHVVVRLLHLPEELAGVRAQRLDVPALAFRVQGIERERALPAPRHAGEHHQLLLGDLQRDALEVVLSGSLHEDGIGLHGLLGQGGPGRISGGVGVLKHAMRCTAGVRHLAPGPALHRGGGHADARPVAFGCGVPGRSATRRST